MTANVNSFSSTKLKELKSGDKITIRHAQDQDQLERGGSRIICEQFPRKAAAAFSTTWASMFPSVSKMTLQEMRQPKQTSITILGGHVPTIQKILSWILSCCEGGGIRAFPTYPIRPYTNYYDVKVTADLMGVDILSKEMESRMNEIMTRQMHSEDVRAMYMRLPRDHDIIREIVVDIANLTFNRRLKAVGAFRTLREEIPQLDEDINELLGPKPEQSRLERTKEREAKKAAKAEKEAETHGKDAGLKSPTPQRQDDECYAAEPQLQTTQISCPVARKAQRGRPAYVSLSLAHIGISKDDFTGDSARPLRSKRPAKKPVGEAAQKQKTDVDTGAGATSEDGRDISTASSSTVESGSVVSPAASNASSVPSSGW